MGKNGTQMTRMTQIFTDKTTTFPMRRLNESRGQILICSLLSVGASTTSKFRTLEKLSKRKNTLGGIKKHPQGIKNILGERKKCLRGIKNTLRETKNTRSIIKVKILTYYNITFGWCFKKYASFIPIPC